MVLYCQWSFVRLCGYGADAVGVHSAKRVDKDLDPRLFLCARSHRHPSVVTPARFW